MHLRQAMGGDAIIRMRTMTGCAIMHIQPAHLWMRMATESAITVRVLTACTMWTRIMTESVIIMGAVHVPETARAGDMAAAEAEGREDTAAKEGGV